MPHKSNFFFFWQWANLFDPSHKKVETMEAPQNRRFYVNMECLPLWPRYIGEEWTLSKTYGIKAWCFGNTLGEHIGNLMRTHWELEGNILGTNEKWKKSSPPKTPTPKLKKINQGTLSACWAFPLAAKNFYFQNCSSPFLAWANTPIINWGYLVYLLDWTVSSSAAFYGSICLWEIFHLPPFENFRLPT